MAANDPTEAALLTLDAVSKSFDGIEAVAGISFTVATGAVIAVVGAGYTGKTTLLDLISGVLKPDQGSIRFNGHDLASLAPHQIAALGISRCFNPPRPFEALSAEDNVIVGALLHERSTAAARRLALSLLDRLGLTGLRHLPASHLTMTQRKCLELARALATRPRLLLLDEMLAETSSEEWTSLTEILTNDAQANGTALLFAEPDLHAIGTLTDRIITLDQGTLGGETPQDTAGPEA